MPVDKRNSEEISACAAIGEQLSAYIDGELNEADEAAVDAHLRDCPDCAKLCSALRTLRVDLAGAQLDPPPELHERIMAKVHRENRLRRLRRFTAAASVGVAAMFCFVIIGGAMSRMGSADNAETVMDAPNYANVAELGDSAANRYSLAEAGKAAEAAMTGGVIDTTLEVEPTIVGTGISSDTLAEDGDTPVLFSAGTPKADATAAPSTTKAPETTAAPATRAPQTTRAEPVEPGVVSIKLPEEMRDLSRLAAKSSIQGLSTTSTEASPASANTAIPAADSLALLCADTDARLAEEQLGTLCVVELDDGQSGVRYLVYDLVTGSRLTLADFLGAPEAPATLGAEADAPYRPTAAGLCLLLPTGETCIAWSENDTLTTCVTRYAMTKPPLCGAE